MKPILFNAEMVRAILDGRKTQTRRLVKEIPLDEQHFTVKGGVALACDGSGYWYRAEKFCRVQPGDVLWVRETYRPNYYSKEIADFYNGGNRNAYRADFDMEKIGDVVPEPKWRPSIHMPREAARLFLRVKDVRIERLQDITASAAYNEGTGKLFLEDIAYSDKNYGCDLDDEYGLAREQFAWLWDSTVKKADLTSYGWDANPWVWVIEFERCEKP